MMTMQPQPSKTILKVENLSVSFGSVTAVGGVSFEMREGEVLGLVGESGSGKSITCRALTGLLPGNAQAAGAVRFLDRELLGMTPGEMRSICGREIAMIFQNPASHLDPLMTLGGHIAEPLRHHFKRTRQAARQGAIEYLRSVQINEVERRVDAYPHELSGGMKQRGMIASAMACQPKLLLADEPTTALDVTVQARILELLRDLNQRHGLSIIFVSHDLAVVSQLCDRVVVMRNGAIVEQGATAEVLREPKHEYTRLLLASQPASLTLPRHDRGSGNPAALFELDGLCVTYSKPGLLPGSRRDVVKALDNASLMIAEGEAFGVVGESGSGKTTVARAIMRLVDPSSGTIQFRGQNVSDMRGANLERYRRSVQMVFQNPFDSLNPQMRIVDAIAEPMIRHRLATRQQATERALELMRQVELPAEFASRKPRQLSGGQCQRVGIARALALDPEVLIADEVTSALDVTIQAQILRLLGRLREERNLTVIYISHDLAVVRRFCDRIAVFRAARLVELGRTEDVLESPKEEYTRLLINAAPRLEPGERTEA